MTIKKLLPKLIFLNEKNKNKSFGKLTTHATIRGRSLNVDKMRWLGGPKIAHFCLRLG